MAAAREIACVVAPLLRGICFDGETGALVRYEAGTGAGDAHAAAGVPWTARGDADSVAGAERGSRSAVEVDADRVLTVSLPAGLPEQRGAAADRIAEILIPAYREFAERHGAPPALVSCPGIGGFAIRAKGSIGATGSSSGARKGGGAGSEEPAAAHDRNSVVAGKIAVVTGGAQGFGEEIARRLHAAGAHLFIADLNLEGAQRLAAELDESGAGGALARAVRVDVGSEESVRAMVDEIVTAAGGIDLFISNAGVLRAGSVKELAASDFDLVTRVNYSGYFLCVKWVAPVMALQNRPSGRYYTDIIQINSKSGLEGSNRNGAYAGSKFGGIGLTQSFALELVGDNIKVNAICPGNFLDGPLWSDPDRGLFVQYLRAGKVPGAKSVADVRRYYEERVPMRRGCTGADVVKAIFYVVEQKYETGQAVPVTGGQIMLA